MIKILIPSRRDEFLDCLLNSMKLSQKDSLYQVIVGDNGLSTNLKSKWNMCTFINIPKPFIFSQAINRMARSNPLKWDYFILNDDTEITTERWLEKLDFFVSKLLTITNGIVSMKIDGRGGSPEQEQLRLFNEIKETANSICFIATLITREAWNIIGELDERFIGYGHEDDDYCVRGWHKGIRCCVTNAITIKHGKEPGIGTAAELFGNNWESMFDLNANRFSDKWGIKFEGRKGLSVAKDHLNCLFNPWHKMEA
jgi:hypothetical protein